MHGICYQLVPGERRHHFDPNTVCPLILESDYCHVLTHVVSLLESREGHIRQVLLENLEGFSSVCTREDMETIVLPQVGLLSADLYHVHTCTQMLLCFMVILAYLHVTQLLQLTTPCFMFVYMPTDSIHNLH